MRTITPSELLPHYDLLIAGGGCAGLSLLHALIREGLAANHNILVVDAEQKSENDRTWCFWEEEEGPFEPIVYHRWPVLDFFSEGFHRELQIAPYQYKLIRAADFYESVRSAAAPFPGLHFLRGKVERSFSSAEQGSGLVVDGQTIRGRFLFNSIYTRPEQLRRHQHWLLQHFKGRFIETAAPVFDPARATLMDFRTSQKEGATFFYVLPFSDRRALVEYTLFSEKLLPPEAYDAALDDYIRNRLGVRSCSMEQEEFGIIPMTNLPFPRRRHHEVFIGTAGGQTKGSSGYTFRNIQRHSTALARSLRLHGHPFAAAATPPRFGFYDSVLLDVLKHRSLEGASVFAQLFRRNDPARVLRFLDNRSRLTEEIRIISTLPVLPFTRSALRQLLP